MFRHQMCHHQGACFVTLPNYIRTIALLAKINQVFKTLKLSSVIKLLLLHEVCMMAVYSLCVDAAVAPARYDGIYGHQA